MSEQQGPNPSMPEEGRLANVPVGHEVPNIMRMPHGPGHEAL